MSQGSHGWDLQFETWGRGCDCCMNQKWQQVKAIQAMGGRQRCKGGGKLEANWERLGGKRTRSNGSVNQKVQVSGQENGCQGMVFLRGVRSHRRWKCKDREHQHRGSQERENSHPPSAGGGFLDSTTEVEKKGEGRWGAQAEDSDTSGRGRACALCLFYPNSITTEHRAVSAALASALGTSESEAALINSSHPNPHVTVSSPQSSSKPTDSLCLNTAVTDSFKPPHQNLMLRNRSLAWILRICHSNLRCVQSAPTSHNTEEESLSTAQQSDFQSLQFKPSLRTNNSINVTTEALSGSREEMLMQWTPSTLP